MTSRGTTLVARAGGQIQ